MTAKTQQHSPEPWELKIVKDALMHFPEFLIQSEGRTLAEAFTGNMDLPHAANFRRIVACVNACASLSAFDLSDRGDVVSIADRLTNYKRLAAENARLREALASTGEWFAESQHAIDCGDSERRIRMYHVIKRIHAALTEEETP